MDNTTLSHVLKIQEAIRQNRLVVFVGAGVSASAGVPTWPYLIESFKSGLPEEMYDPADFLKTAEIYREAMGHVDYLSNIKKVLKYGEVSSTVVHDAIMSINPSHIITTNYDDLLEQAAAHNNKQYYVVAKDEDLPLNRGEKMIVKMHGDFTNNNIVLTENDYADYSRKFPLIRSFLRSLFTTHVVLFVGFSFKDLNLKFILREIKTELGDNMHRVYLLTDEPKDALTYSYFLNNGVQLLCIPDDISSRIISGQKIEDHSNELSNEHSIALYKALCVLRAYDIFYDSFIERAENFLSYDQDQIRYWGRYLSHMFGGNESDSVSVLDCEIELPARYKQKFEAFMPKMSTSNTHANAEEEKWQWLKRKLHENGINYIDKYKIYDAQNENTNNNEDLIGQIYSVSLERLESQLQTLSHQPLHYTIDDLKLPYLQFKLGRYYDAYSTYKRLAPEMWQRRKYILYFLCLYNMRTSFGWAWTDMSDRGNDFKKESDYVYSIPLNGILNDLPIEANIKRILEELVNGTLLKNQLIKTSELNDKLFRQRKSSERGGMSLNSHVNQLLEEFIQAFNFCNENYILNDIYEYAKNSYVKMAEGLINSVLTRSNQQNFQSKIDELPSVTMYLFVFMLNPGTLKNILDEAKEQKIPVEEDFIKELKNIIHNIAEDIDKHGANHLMSPHLVTQYVKNILLLQKAIEQPIAVEDLYKIIITYWNSRNDYLNETAGAIMWMINNYPPSGKEAAQILTILSNERLLEHYCPLIMISKLSEIVQQEGEEMDDRFYRHQFRTWRDVVLAASFYNALPADTQVIVKQYVQEKVTHMYALAQAEVLTRARFITKELYVKLSGTIKQPYCNRSNVESYICSNLVKLYNDDGYSDFKELLDETAEESKCLRFLLAPDKFEKISEIQVDWVYYVPDEQLSILINNKEIRRLIIRSSDHVGWAHSLLNRMLEIEKK
jgi:hypothetical protein